MSYRLGQEVPLCQEQELQYPPGTTIGDWGMLEGASWTRERRSCQCRKVPVANSASCYVLDTLGSRLGAESGGYTLNDNRSIRRQLVPATVFHLSCSGCFREAHNTPDLSGICVAERTRIDVRILSAALSRRWLCQSGMTSSMLSGRDGGHHAVLKDSRLGSWSQSADHRPPDC